MIRFTRGAAYAVATAAFTAAMTFSAPSQAQAADFTTSVPVVQTVSPVQAAPAAVLPAAPQAATAEVAAPAPVAVAAEGQVAPVATPFSGTIAPITGAQPQPTLEDLVSAHAADAAGDTEADCLAKAVYFEARGESTEGQVAVAEVVMNRAASGRYPGTLCKVVTQPAQFSFVHKGRVPTPNFASAAWRKAVGVARIALAKLADTLPPGVLWYHASYVKPSWGKRLTRTAQIGVHIFYS